MELYGNKSPSLPQKFSILLAESALVGVSFAVLFGDLFEGWRAFGPEPCVPRNQLLFAFNLTVFARFLLTLFVFLKRTIPWEEVVSVPMAFALYLVGFPLLARSQTVPFGGLEGLGILLFVSGSLINTLSEYQRHVWKGHAENRGKLFTGGLFAWSMHPNYFGDLLWVSGYALVTRNVYASLIPLVLFVFFYAYNIPKLDAYLSEHYPEQFPEYRRTTKRLIPFVL